MNIQRFRQVLAYIEARPDRWDQRFPCQCFGGHTRNIFGVEYDSSFKSLLNELDCSYDEAVWIFSPKRTLDDFRTVARRPFA